MANPWRNGDGRCVHPHAPAGGGGCGTSVDPQPHGLTPVPHGVAHPHAPAAVEATFHPRDHRDLLDALYAALADGVVVEPAPSGYRDALVELVAARVDRTAGRKRHFEHAMRRLRRALEAADWHPTDSMHKRALRLDAQIATWRMLCTSGPAAPPRPPVLHAKFEYVYVARGGETIAEVAGYYQLENPWVLTHPAYGYALEMRLQPGDTLYVPYSQRRLKLLIHQTDAMVERAKEALEEVLEAVHLQQEEFEDVLLMIECAAIVVNILAGLAGGVRMMLDTTKTFHELNHEIAHWALEEFGKTQFELLNAGLAANKSPVRGWVLVLRHSPIGWLSPTYWTALAGVLWNTVWTHDREEAGRYLDLWWGGSEKDRETRSEVFARSAHLQIEQLENHIDFLRDQLKSRIYGYRPRQP